jgi:activator of HSP90 ATPase
MTIHQEALIPATPTEIYNYLTDGPTFAAATGMAAWIEPREGASFSIFGGRIDGRMIELVPARRVVQAWRFGDAHPDEWDAGVYSIVRFTLTAEGDRTRFAIDHEAVPVQWRDHLEGGYPTFYAEPMTRWFARAAVG